MTDQRDARGMHISNGPQWHVEDCLRAAGDDGAVTILHHLMRDDPLTQQHSDIENGRWYSKLRFGHPPQGIPPAPNRLIHVRMYQPNWKSLDPVAWAKHSVEMLSAIDSGGRVHNLWNDPLVCVSPANEQNLHYERGDNNEANQHLYQTVEAYREIAAWNAAWADEVNRLLPNRKALLCWPALAFGHEPPGFQPDGEYTIPEIRAAIARFEIMATHPYALLHTAGAKSAPGGAEAYFYMLRDFRLAGFDNPRDPGGVLAQFPDKPLLITECGTFTHTAVARTAETLAAMKATLAKAAASGRVLGITWFIWHSDQAHPTNVIWPNEGLRNALANLPPYRTAAAVPIARVSGAAPLPSPVPPTAPSPAPPTSPGPTTLTFVVEARIQVLPGEKSWYAVARRALGHPNATAKHVAALQAANPVEAAGGLRVGQWLRSPWHKVERSG
ncbi:MAG: hypothetical protein IT341_07105 [Chloroflexi bacterium]|nr:hypothetical protein [Chloroflexota bacterium]